MKRRKGSRVLTCLALLLATAASVPSGIRVSAANTSHGYTDSTEGQAVIASRLWELFFGESGANESKEQKFLCPGGEAFGVKICGGDVCVTRVLDTEACGSLAEGDVIRAIGGKEIDSIDDVSQILSSHRGGDITVDVRRGSRSTTVRVTPQKCGDEYQLGIILKDTTTGIGTVTYYDTATGEFGGLGHGISAKDGKTAIKMTRGTATGVILAGALRGVPSAPGELRGVLTDKSIGTLSSNTECGVFGKMDAAAIPLGQPIEVAERDEIREGDATILTTVKNGKKQSFSVSIHDIDYTSQGTKSFRLTVTDDALIAITGGIVRGMSGSPIVQNGKLVGAITHVFINDPTRGYGIYAEWMIKN